MKRTKALLIMMLAGAVALASAASQQAPAAAAAKPADTDLPISRGPPPPADADLAIADDEARLPPAAAEPPPPVCECKLPADGGGYYGRGKQYVEMGCTCKNACEFAPSGKPSCATLCKCPDIGSGHGKLTDISLQTFDATRGPLKANFNNWSRHGLRRLAGAEGWFVAA